MSSILYKGKNESTNNYNYLVGEPGTYVPPPAITTWSPSYITASYWFDFLNPSSVTLDVSGIVTQLLDSSGSNRNTSTTFGSPIYYDSDYLVFDGFNDYYSLPVVTSARRSVFIVAQGGNITRGILAGAAPSDLTPVWNVNGGSVAYRRRQGQTIYSANDGSGRTISDWAVGGWVFGATDALLMTHNGHVVYNSATGTNWSSLDLQINTIGRDFLGADQFFDGGLRELIVVPETVSESTRQNIEGYLCHKWNLNEWLPSDHPYKSAPPPAP